MLPKVWYVITLRFDNLIVKEFIRQLEDLHTTIKLKLEEAQDWYKAIANRFRKDQPSFWVGDKMWFLLYNIENN